MAEKYPPDFLRRVTREFGYGSPIATAVLDDQAFAGHHLDEVEVGCRLRLAAEQARVNFLRTPFHSTRVVCRQRDVGNACYCIDIYTQWLQLRDAQRKAAAAQ